MTGQEINTLVNVNKYDWASVEPSIFGTLFERTLDPSKRSQIGAHYTSRDDIETLLKPVLLAPLRREWEEVKRKCEEELWPKVVKAEPSRGAERPRPRTRGQRKAFDRAILDFAERLHHVTVLDPACGSGNFLYVAIHMLLDLEKEVIAYAATRGLSLVPHVGPRSFTGWRSTPMPSSLPRWSSGSAILQWMHYNGFKMPDHPVLAPIESIRCMDAILDLSDPEHPKEPEWPEAEFIVGNPPFLGNKRMRSELGDDYVACTLETLCAIGCQPRRTCAATGLRKLGMPSQYRRSACAGLLATTGIKQVGVERKCSNESIESGKIFFADFGPRLDSRWRDRSHQHGWVCGQGGSGRAAISTDELCAHINADLTSRLDATTDSGV